MWAKRWRAGGRERIVHPGGRLVLGGAAHPKPKEGAANSYLHDVLRNAISTPHAYVLFYLILNRRMQLAVAQLSATRHAEGQEQEPYT